MSTLSRLLIGTAKVFAVVVALFVAYAAWSVWREREARSSALAFCDRFRVGGSMSEVAAAAANEGEKLLRSVERNRIRVGYIGTYPFSRHYCVVEAEAGVIARLRTTHRD